ncbi:MAG: hypothetical protein MK066_04635 [Crocinitomicaceae bacterium]|nr:hypothetical protein [Crocinitomicaceae bacterium]
MKNILLVIGLSTIFLGCKKHDIHPRNSIQEQSIDWGQKNIPSGTKIAEKVNGVVICTIDEDILKIAISNYYGGGSTITKRMIVKEFKPNSPNSFFGLRGRVKNCQIVTRYFFELIPFTLPNGTIEFYLPEAGHEQHVTGFAGSVCKLKLHSASAGQAFGSACFSIYGNSESTQPTDTDGTNGLIMEIASLI